MFSYNSLSNSLARHLAPWLSGLSFAVAAIAMTGAPSVAQAPHGPRYASVTAAAQPVSLAPGKTGKLVIRVAVAPGFHLNSAKPTDPSLIATSFAPSAVKGVHYRAAQFPKSVMVKTAAGTIPAYTGTVAIVVPFTLDKSAHPGQTTLGGTLTYQGCNATACYPPKQDKISATVAVK